METVVIAGAGIIGLASALELAARGLRVTVLERGHGMREASWAAAGMLAAHDPENPAALGELARFSLSLYPNFVARLQELSGQRVNIHTTRTLQFLPATRNQPAHGRMLSVPEASALIPGLKIQPGHSAWLLDEQSVDPRELGEALCLAIQAAGIEVRENTPLLSSRQDGHRLEITTPADTLHADRLVVTTGAWSASEQRSSLHILPAGSVVPRKGQMLRIQPPDGTSLTTVIRSREVYIVPRENGSLVVGATVEDAGFDRHIRAGATQWLLQQAAQLWEPLAGIKPELVDEVWTGIRPGTPDQLPILGTLQHPQVFFATGHYRNGILLAPGTARVMTQLICGEAPMAGIAPFNARRFAPAMEPI